MTTTFSPPLASDAVYGEILEKVYDAALKPQDWPAALACIARWLGASRALMFTPERGLGDGGFFYPHGVSAEEMTIWSSRYVGTDFWTARALDRKLVFEGSVMLDGDLSTRTELLRSDYYREHLTRMGIGWLLSGVVLAPANGSLPFVATSFYRDTDAETGFDETARRRMTMVLPHLSRALGVMFRLQDAPLQAASSAAALDMLGFGVLTLDGEGRILQANRAARDMLAESDGIALRDTRLWVADPAARASCQRALRDSLGRGSGQSVSHFSDALRVPKERGSGAYLLQMSQLPDSSQFGLLQAGAKAVVFITDEGRNNTVDAGLLMKTYRLSPAEARCAISLGEGKIATAAQHMGLSPHTVRSQLKQVYAKTGCKSRADLTRLMFSLARV